MTTKPSQMLYRLLCTVLNLSASTKCYYANYWLMWGNVAISRLQFIGWCLPLVNLFPDVGVVTSDRLENSNMTAKA
jgi:hypothetical protein